MAITFTLAFRQVADAAGVTNDAEATALQACLAKYTRPHTVVGTLTYLMDRIVNAVKSIFGKSDWQQMVKTIQERAIKACEDNGTYDSKATDPAQQKFNKKVLESTKLAARELLSLALEVHQNPSAKIDDAKLEKITIRALAAEIQSISRQARAQQKSA